MKRILATLFFTITAFSSFSQQTDDWIKKLENPRSSRFKLKDKNHVKFFKQYDFSEITIPKTDFIGFIGADYKRIQMIYDYSEKVDDSTYFINGYSQVGSNKCDFNGELVINEIREFETYQLGADNIYADSSIAFQGLIIGHYVINENPEQKYIGQFDGVFTIWFYINADDKVIYDDMNNHSDSYKNNQYIGKWTSYDSNKSKVCNWGEYRIPFSGDLDIGAGEFSVNPKYIDNGWRNFKR